MNILKLMTAGFLFLPTNAIASENTIDHILSEFEAIEIMTHSQPAQANDKLKKLQLDYGFTDEFAMFSERYALVKKDIQNALKEVNNLQISSIQNSVITNQSHVQNVKFENVKTLKDLLPYIHKGTLVFLDIDDTVLIKSMIDHKVEPIERDIANTIMEMRERGGIVLGLSIRSLNASDRAITDLNSININYGHFAPQTIKEGPFINSNNSVGYQYGIIFAAANNFSEKGSQKGRILLEFLRNNPQLNITNVVFADDSKDNTDDVDEALRQAQISSVVFQYSGGQQRNIEITEQAAHMQFGVAPLKAEEEEMARYNISSVEELRAYKIQAHDVGMGLEDYLQMIR